ncbi:hypothetical protein [Chromobacterium haemolyticum]|uniref:hypothetical protein n=1 Tax=Chromobacterium haemolyticum TaxID=394935 RepID=UPI00244CD938|nr:hypothetical protein [Chromobacterium haemolyticum]MDH0342160.1 hypothetical protein [Chromobacterium haemolyticum]
MTESSAVDWPHKRDVVILINPKKRKNVERILLAGAVAVAVLSMLLGSGGPVDQWAKRQDVQAKRERLEPTMRKLAADGQPNAIIWLGENFPEKDIRGLEMLADQGNAQALWALAGVKYALHQDVKEASRLVAKAAEKGYEPAVEWQIRKAKSAQ